MHKKIVSSLLVFTLVLASLVLPASADKGLNKVDDLRGVWVASVVNIDYPKVRATDPVSLKAEADAILNRAESMGLNAVFLQVRPTGDALYKSAIFPWSKYLTGEQGLAPDDEFDPLSYWISEAHKKGIAVHAWINPYRITKKSANEPVQTVDMLDSGNPARKNPTYVIAHTDGNLYYNPGMPEVRKLIVDGVTEIISNYDIDGIHFDDYFYPGTEFSDSTTFVQYGNGLSLADWRRENVNQLMRDVDSAVKKLDPTVLFGISPFGIWANKSSIASGSDTRGLESFSAHYADSVQWIKEGSIDYIMPQIYWNIGFDIANYEVLLNWWLNITKETDVKLYIGHAAYRAGNTDSKSAWYGDGELIKQLVMNQSKQGVSGSVFFSHRSFANRPSLEAVVKSYYEFKDGAEVNTSLSVNNPSSNIRTGYDNYYISGESNPLLPLYVNGTEVINRSSKGYFGVYMPLQPGANTFTFIQGDQVKSIVITKGWSTGSSNTMDEAYISKSSTFPQQQEMWLPGETITLSCIAPIGSAVTASIGGQVITLKPNSTYRTDGKLVPTTFKGSFTMPEVREGSHTMVLGAPVYVMNYNGVTHTQKAPATIGVVSDKSPYFAQVTGQDVDTYFSSDSSKGSAYLISRGMRDTITAMTGDYVRLGSGKWMKKSQVAIFFDFREPQNRISSATLETSELYDILALDMIEPAAVSAELKNGMLIVDFSNTTALPALKIPSASIISSVDTVTEEDRSQYVITFDSESSLNGYHIEKSESGVNVFLKRPVYATSGDLPLKGIKILVDPGHGGSDPGAIGILGTSYSEKHINLDTSLKLKEALTDLGATVYMTRSTDVYVSLFDRLRLSYQLKPDLFISMHANSIGPDVNINNVSGFSVHYKQELAKSASKSVLDSVITDLSRKSRGLNINNFYVVRGTWAPSILLETGFVPNPLEFEWLSDASQQEQLAREVASGILDYFRR
ncbi:MULTISPECIES: N-acetylmuramoyl-L-alanine amidase [unclassified Fusibacter]|uniref:N-acetylmuramoyl-L-alanine amidase n=1 Tax=unclassified Fusibacter TaxID=2624464 RepID=UPI0010125D06|nr:MULTISPECIES: N-acetylmuramoyl-L-alanine amidase [unclassified Fusibacter]MCK8060049.1 family 10 glycosylhydrolase [Fusibacter sp. A2]NPE22191.1 family 10 glycosylhydrolase [Fusibacter sp. A1]RXV60967.1 N-acetylmuramoyl-L-alanine amidase [Fusibacter sp. A1]